MAFRGSFEDDALDRYDVRVIKRTPMLGRYEARVPVRVPVYGDRCVLQIEIDKGDARVTVEGFPNELHHTYGDNRLCMWDPSDPPERRWTPDKGLLALIETALVHLFQERHVAVTGEAWPGEEAAHPPDEPKREAPPINEASGPAPSAPVRAPTRLEKAA